MAYDSGLGDDGEVFFSTIPYPPSSTCIPQIDS